MLCNTSHAGRAPEASEPGRLAVAAAKGRLA